jgi:hypothetical protein
VRFSTIAVIHRISVFSGGFIGVFLIFFVLGEGYTGLRDRRSSEGFRGVYQGRVEGVLDRGSGPSSLLRMYSPGGNRLLSF